MEVAQARILELERILSQLDIWIWLGYRIVRHDGRCVVVDVNVCVKNLWITTSWSGRPSSRSQPRLRVLSTGVNEQTAGRDMLGLTSRRHGMIWSDH
jgi:hypothetical protein